MYPHTLFSLTPPFPRTRRVFVAMSFEPRFNARWTKVLIPALKSLSHEGEPLDPFRVDLSRASDAILSKILTAIADSHCIVADITGLIEIDGRMIRNANVMYEVGLAHAVRLPEEVILFRSDRGSLDFDIAGVRVHQYSPDDSPAKARRVVADTVTESLAELRLHRLASVRAASKRLTTHAMTFLVKAIADNGLTYPSPESFGNTPSQALSAALVVGVKMQAIDLLLELGALRAEPAKLTPELLSKVAETEFGPFLSYAPTLFGHALFEFIVESIGARAPEMQESIRAYRAARKLTE